MWRVLPYPTVYSAIEISRVGLEYIYISKAIDIQKSLLSRVSCADEFRSASLLEDMVADPEIASTLWTMTSSKSTKLGSAKKENIFHPSSRKAGQISRKAIRQTKLSNILSEKNKKHNASGTSSNFSVTGSGVFMSILS
jgi:hypothetical protein